MTVQFYSSDSLAGIFFSGAKGIVCIISVIVINGKQNEATFIETFIEQFSNLILEKQPENNDGVHRKFN